ncbi:MAG: cation transporter [Deltaproteobacteria bacterium]|nr:cation transporter [Deltaproteobacteria bacterium]
MKAGAYKATVVGIVFNTLLFIIKLVTGIMSGSIALLSDAINSFTDIITSVAIFICVRISDKEADEGHPFGHKRAEPIAGILVAILAGILGFEIIRASIERLISGEAPSIGAITLLIPAITIIVKLLMARYFRKVGEELRSPGIKASAVDSINDVYLAIATLIGIAGAALGYNFLDPLAGLVISGWIIYSGYHIGVENIDYLMGSAPEKEMTETIKSAALSVGGVQALNDVRAHYVGNFIHVEVHIEVDRHLSTFDSHAIGENAAKAIENLEAIEKAFIHVDPI